MITPPAPHRQRGAILVLLLIGIIMAGAYLFYRTSNHTFSRTQRDAQLSATLARAKESLIAYAVIDDKRPGRLLCPDLIGNGISPILSRDDCDAYNGGLPWKTLDLGEGGDDRGTPFHIVLSRLFAGDRTTPPLNSDTPAELRAIAADGSLNDDIVAIIIAPRGELDPANNGSGNDYQAGRSDAEGNNDLFALVSRRELMAAVEKRIANETLTCLKNHATASPPEQAYPWPAPLSSSNRRGQANSYFGQLPLTQAGAGPESQLKQAQRNLDSAKMKLSAASTASDQLAALQGLAETVNYAQVLFDKIYSEAKNLSLLAEATMTAGGRLASAIVLATDQNKAESDKPKNGSQISPSEKTTLLDRSASGESALLALKQSLTDSGIDPYPNELRTRDQLLQQRLAAAQSLPSAMALNDLQASATALQSLFTKSSSRNPEISAALNQASSTSSNARLATEQAASSPNDNDKVAAAINTAAILSTAIGTLQSTIAASRVNLHASEISSRSEQLKTRLATLNTAPSPAAAEALAETLSTLNAIVSSLETASSLVVTARTASLKTLPAALTVARAGSDFAEIKAQTSAAISAAETLANAIANNADNVTLESLSLIGENYVHAHQAFSTANSTEKGLVDYALAMQTPAVDIEYWAEILSRNAADLALQARKSTTASKTKENTESAFSAAGQVLSSLDGSKGAIARLEAYVASPGSKSKQDAAATAISLTSSLLEALLSRSINLDAQLASGAAAAFPTLWASRSCNFMQPLTGEDSWWTTNDWGGSLFFQISRREHGSTGHLAVNGAGSYHIVVIAAGKALAHQSRSLRNTAHFFESVNADSSRDGNASSPKPGFASLPASASFNDRLAY